MNNNHYETSEYSDITCCTSEYDDSCHFLDKCPLKTIDDEEEQKNKTIYLILFSNIDLA